MNPIVIVALISLVGVAFTAINQSFGIYLKNRLENKHKKGLLDRTCISLEVDRLCASLRAELQADRVFLGKFHNGGSFKTGLPMDKFTVYGEDYDIRAKDSLKRKYVGCMLTVAPYMFHKLLVENACFKPDTSVMIDKTYMEDLQERQISSFYAILIKDLKGNPIAFVSAEYVEQHDISVSEQSSLWRWHNKFLGAIVQKTY